MSAREAEVLAALADHRSNAQIAGLLHISVRTVESHVSSLLRKYGAADRRELADLVVSGREPGLVGPGMAGPGTAGPGLVEPGVAGLPASRTTFVGRTAESTAAVSALEQDRLVTLLGPGGMGKTRLAAVVAGELAVPGAFVDLVPIRDGLVTWAVAGMLGVTERPPQTLEQALVERLRAGRSLLVLDNCEHVIEEVTALVERLLAACPEATVLATSRERLGVPGEQTVLLPPLAADSDAVELFTDRARAVDPSFAADRDDVAEVCTRLDGMPLAIELAAARIGSLGLDGLRTALDDRLRLLAGGRGADPRHRSLGAVIGWSHDLLDDREQLLFRRLAVYVGGFDLDAAGATSPDLPRGEIADLLGRLTDKSLLVRRASRWRLLETIRQFALSRLTDAELATARHHHLHWAATTAATLENHLVSRVGDCLTVGGVQVRASQGGEAASMRGSSWPLLQRREVRAWAPPTSRNLRHGTLDPSNRPPPHHETVDGSGWRSAYDEVVDDLRVALAGTAAAPNSTAHRLARSLGHLTFARRGFVESIGHYRSAADRAEDGVAAARDLRSAADAALAIADGQTTVELLLDAADRAVADGNVRATMLASAVIAINRYPTGPLFDFPADHTARLLAEAVANAVPTDPHHATPPTRPAIPPSEAAADAAPTELHLAVPPAGVKAVPADPQVAALLATAKAWEHGDRRIGADTALAQEAVEAARVAGDPVLIAGALDALGTAAGNAGRLREARSYALERMRLVEPLPRHEPYAASEIIDAYWVASTTAISTGDLPAALSVARAGLVDDPVGDHAYISLPRLIRVYALTGRFDACLEQADALWNRWQRAGSPPMEWMASAVATAALVHGLRDDGSFADWQARAREMARADDPNTASSLAASAAFAQARVAIHTWPRKAAAHTGSGNDAAATGPGNDGVRVASGGHDDRAAELVSQAFADFQELWWAPYARASGAELAVVAGLPDAADRLVAAAPAGAENDWAAACLTRAAARLTGDLGGMRSAVAAFERIDARFERACTLLLTPDGQTEGRAELEELRVPIRADDSVR
ncbi:putative ATPase [Kribbella sp. VKM Ac-2527]|uniref:Putative ATPase n=1 Tax=Kribbella caucasensis TaxID=2512215 RepID=A0A4R6K871_9ACTN|nr:putative ATPase [Kribbella sp. VKM Ac-2527]